MTFNNRIQKYLAFQRGAPRALLAPKMPPPLLAKQRFFFWWDKEQR
jgi:hypothetical protein